MSAGQDVVHPGHEVRLLFNFLLALGNVLLFCILQTGETQSVNVLMCHHTLSGDIP